jgi:hypothetical protein
MIHFPGENTGEDKREPLPELETHGIIYSMLQDQLHSQVDLDDWLVRSLR